MADSALMSVTLNGHRRTASSRTAVDETPSESRRGRSLLPRDHTHTHGRLQKSHLDRETLAVDLKPREDISTFEGTPVAGGTRSKRAASFKTFLAKDLSKSPRKKGGDKETKQSKKEDTRLLKKSKSSTSLSALLSRPRSSKSQKPGRELDCKDKENQTPPGSAGVVPPPIWAQFATQVTLDQPSATKIPLNDTRTRDREMAMYTPTQYSPSKQRNFGDVQRPAFSDGRSLRKRPESTCSAAPCQSLGDPHKSHDAVDQVHSKAPGKAISTSYLTNGIFETGPDVESRHPKPSIPGVHSNLGQATLDVGKRGSRVMAAVAAFNGKSKELPEAPQSDRAIVSMTSCEIETAFEALLEKRNVPHNTRDKMRSLDINIKANFIKQNEVASGSASSSDGLAARSAALSDGKLHDDQANIADRHEAYPASSAPASPKKSRPRSLTFTFHKSDQSPTKKQKSDRSPSRGRTDRTAPNTPSDPASRPISSHGSLFNKVDKFAQPEQIIAYLKKTRSPQDIEVGKMNKLRQILRNETVSWVESFIGQGGMSELLDLLYRTIEVEWREEHEDDLLHEVLLCLKALSTTSSAMLQLSTIQSKLFPTLVGLVFDEERKGPSEYSTRTLIFNILYAYLTASPLTEVPVRARTLLSYLRDPTQSEEAQPPGFIVEIYHNRPFRVWTKELSNLTKEVFWIFLHHLNIIPYPAPTNMVGSYYARNFPRDHPPVAAAPYVGGVEWDATAYVTAHLDLLNGIIASLPTVEERNILREEMRDSGFERLMGASLRTCKEKLYGSVHEALSIWVGAAREDAWPFKDVREGPPSQETKSSPKKSSRKKDQVPKLDMPKLDFGIGDGTDGAATEWVL